nr:glutathione S-transferase family protein [Aliikangiella sp. G2MR2-5]
MLEEVGAEYQQELIEYVEPMKSPEYLNINPMGKVPAISHRGKIVTECAAICAYLADVFPDKQLAPEIDVRADYYRWLFFGAGPLESAITNNSMKLEFKPEQERMLGYGTYAKTIEVLATKLGASTYITGETFSAADVYIGSHVIWGLQFGTIDSRTEFNDYAERLTSRPAYITARKIDADLIGK